MDFIKGQAETIADIRYKKDQLQQDYANVDRSLQDVRAGHRSVLRSTAVESVLNKSANAISESDPIYQKADIATRERMMAGQKRIDDLRK